MANPQRVGVLRKGTIPALTDQPVRRNRVVAIMSILSVVNGIKIGHIQVIAQARITQGLRVMVIILNVANGPGNVRRAQRNQGSLVTGSRAQAVLSPVVPQAPSNRNRSVTGSLRQNGRRQSEQSLRVNRLGQLRHWCDNLAPRVWMQQC